MNILNDTLVMRLSKFQWPEALQGKPPLSSTHKLQEKKKSGSITVYKRFQEQYQPPQYMIQVINKIIYYKTVNTNFELLNLLIVPMKEMYLIFSSNSPLTCTG